MVANSVHKSLEKHFNKILDFENKENHLGQFCLLFSSRKGSEILLT